MNHTERQINYENWFLGMVVDAIKREREKSMPNRATTPCQYCGRAMNVHGARCLPHPEDRASRQERGYDRDWQALRLSFLALYPLCQDCKAECDILGDFKVTEATEVHHIIPIRDAPELRLDWGNLRALCKPCHSKRTMTDQHKDNAI